MRKIFLFIGIIACFACGRKEVKTDGLYHVDSRIILDLPTPTPLSEVAENVEFISLETRGDALVGTVTSCALTDSLLIVYSARSGVTVFDSRTGKFKYRINGFRDPGPAGYDGAITPLSIDGHGRILLTKDGKPGIWNYITGEKTGGLLPVERLKYKQLLFVGDSLLAGNLGNITPNSTSALDIVSLNGDIVREYGFVENMDTPKYTNEHIYRIDLSFLYDFGGYINFTRMARDTVFGIDKGTLELTPRIALNIGDMIIPNDPVTPIEGGGRIEGILEGKKDGSLHTDKYINVTFIAESGRYLFIKYRHDIYSHLVYYNKETGKTVYVDKAGDPQREYGFTDDIANISKFFPAGITPDGRAYALITAKNLTDEVGPERASKIGMTGADDNPVLIIAKLRK